MQQVPVHTIYVIIHVLVNKHTAVLYYKILYLVIWNLGHFCDVHLNAVVEMRLKYQRFLQIAPVDFIWLTQNAKASFYVIFKWAADRYF